MVRMVRKQVYIDDRQERLLKEQAALTGRTESDLIREAIDAAYDGELEQARCAVALRRLFEIGDEAMEELKDKPLEGPVWPGRAALYEPSRHMPK